MTEWDYKFIEGLKLPLWIIGIVFVFYVLYQIKPLGEFLLSFVTSFKIYFHKKAYEKKARLSYLLFSQKCHDGLEKKLVEYSEKYGCNRCDAASDCLLSGDLTVRAQFRKISNEEEKLPNGKKLSCYKIKD
jgi:hypothetical protein